MKRREFIKQSAAITGGLAFSGLGAPLLSGCSKPMPFKISLAEWSLHRALWNKEIDHLDFATIAKNNFGIDGIEYVNSFFSKRPKTSHILMK